MDVVLIFNKVDSWCDGNPATAYYANNLLLHDYAYGWLGAEAPTTAIFASQYAPYGATVQQSNGSSSLFALGVATPAKLAPVLPASWQAPEWHVKQLQADNGTAPASYALHAATASGAALDLVLTQLHPDRDCGTVNAWEAAGDGASTYLVSKPRLRAQGSFTPAGGAPVVGLKGTLYLSHFFTTILSSAPAPPWNWFFAILEGGWAFDITLYLGANTGDVTSGYMRVMDASQVSHVVPFPDFSVTHSAPWRSPETGILYYGHHLFVVPAGACGPDSVTLDVRTHTQDNEFDVPPDSPFAPAYEGIGVAQALIGARLAFGVSSTEFHGVQVFGGRAH